MARHGLLTLIVLSGFVSSAVAQDAAPTRGQAAPAETAKSDKPAPTQEELFKQLSETLTGATLIGYFTTAGSDSDHPLKEDKYTLGRVYKLPDGDFWQFEAKLGFGERSMTMPMALEVKWAGDTPMITLTDTTIPMMGTYTARVFLYQNQYSGTWKHGPAGGHLFGRVEKASADKPAEAAK